MIKRIMIIILAIKNDIIFLYTTLFNPDTKTIIKIAIIGMIIYVLSPIDIISDMFPLIGQLDDIAVILFVTHWIKGQIQHPEYKKNKTRTIRKITSIK